MGRVRSDKELPGCGKRDADKINIRKVGQWRQECLRPANKNEKIGEMQDQWSSCVPFSCQLVRLFFLLFVFSWWSRVLHLVASFGPETQYSCPVLSFLLGGSHYSLLSQCVYKAGQSGTGPGRRTLCLARFVLQDGYSSNGKYWVLSPVWCDPYASAV